MSEEEIIFLEKRIKELIIFKKKGIKNIGFAMVGECFSVDVALGVLKKILKQKTNKEDEYRRNKIK
jgi:hypothetical protein